MAAPVCVSCDSELEQGQCVAEAFAPIVGREGRHAGACWGGRFPTVDEHRAWQNRTPRPTLLAPLPPPPPAPEPAVAAQLELEL